MATKILTKNSPTTTNVPANLEAGELAVNVADQKLWVGDGTATPVPLVGGGSVGVGTFQGQTLRWDEDTTQEWLATSDMIIDDTGDVLIGTTTKGWDAGLPKLLVSGGIQSGVNTGNDWHITIDAGTIKATGVSGVEIGMTHSANNYNFQTGGTDKVTISNGGSFAISTLAGGGSTTATIDNTGRVIRTVSDSRLKKDVMTTPHGLGLVELLNPVQFKWVDEAAGGKEFSQGFIAQDIEALIPAVVHTNAADPEGMRAFDQTQLIAPIVKAIQELSSTVTALTTRVEQLEA